MIQVYVTNLHLKSTHFLRHEVQAFNCALILNTLQEIHMQCMAYEYGPARMKPVLAVKVGSGDSNADLVFCK